jgi:isoprenylcysteine carboxyl methyltransferase (ICMT) family protein YpbQ
MHGFGAMYSFLGHVISATLVFLAISVIYWRIPKENRTMKHPVYFFLVIAELIGVYMLFSHYGGIVWQWLIMLSLNVFLFAISRLFPEDIKQGRP